MGFAKQSNFVRLPRQLGKQLLIQRFIISDESPQIIDNTVIGQQIIGRG